MSVELKVCVQCLSCPWRVGANPDRDIPGYSRELHEQLESETIAEPGVYMPSSTLRIMACHVTKPGEDRYCAGWLMNQLGEGNNLPLRVKLARDPTFGGMKLLGPQHATLADTLDRSKFDVPPEPDDL